MLFSGDISDERGDRLRGDCKHGPKGEENGEREGGRRHDFLDSSRSRNCDRLDLADAHEEREESQLEPSVFNDQDRTRAAHGEQRSRGSQNHPADEHRHGHRFLTQATSTTHWTLTLQPRWWAELRRARPKSFLNQPHLTLSAWPPMVTTSA